MKILFVWFDIASGHKPGVNHGLAWISAYLKPKGHQVNCQRIRDDINLEAVVQAVQNYHPDCIGFSLTTNQRRYLDSYAKVIRKHFGGLMIAGGVHPTLDPSDVLTCPYIDGVCIGEGEKPLAILGEYLDNDKTSYWKTPSFWWKRKNGGREIIIKNQLEPFEKDLSSFPSPDYSIFEIAKIQAELGGFANIMVGRACPYSCTYCCNHALRSVYHDTSKYFRILPVENALAFLEDYKQNFPETKGFIFEDDLLLYNSEWILKFAQDYQKRIGLPYTCNGRFELMQHEGIINALKESGCRMVMLGLESGDEEFRRVVLRRGYSDKQIYNTVRLLNKVRLSYFTYNILGFPFETKEQMEKTVALNQAIRPHSGMAFFFYPYPKTTLFRLCRKHNLLNLQRMKEVSGYREKPTIKLPNSIEKNCIRLQRKLMLYFIARRSSILFHINSLLLDRIIHKALMLHPSFFINLFTKENFLKRFLRRLQYKRL